MKSYSPIKLALVALAATSLSLISSPVSSAATVTASGSDAPICNQSVSTNAGVIAYRLSGGDCVLQFNDVGTTFNWTAPSNLYAISYLVVGGGGGGGTGYDNAGGGGGAGGMVLTGTASINPGTIYSIQVGAGGSGGADTRTNNAGTAGSSSRFGSVTALGGGLGWGSRTGGANGSLAQTLSAAPVGGFGTGGGSGGNGGGGASTAGGTGGVNTGGSAGTGLSNSQTGTAVIYGGGGAGGAGGAGISVAVDGATGAANTGKGGVGGTSPSGDSAAGGNGGSGIVVLRYTPVSATVNSFTFSGGLNKAFYRTSNTISINVAIPSTVTFLAKGKRIGGCINIPATGSASSYIATCNWMPSVKGATIVSAAIKPNTPYLAGTTPDINVSVVARVNNR